VSTACISEVRLNGTAVGEIGIYAGYAGIFDVPTALVTGDVAATKEASALLGDVDTVAVKQGIGRFAANVWSPDEILPRIREKAQMALAGVKEPWKFDLPLNVAVDLLRSAEADMAEMVPGSERTGPRTVEFTHDDPVLAYKGLQAMITLAGVAAGRWASGLYSRGKPVN
jgi:D-amino peptidase